MDIYLDIYLDIYFIYSFNHYLNMINKKYNKASNYLKNSILCDLWYSNSLKRTLKVFISLWIILDSELIVNILEEKFIIETMFKNKHTILKLMNYTFIPINNLFSFSRYVYSFSAFIYVFLYSYRGQKIIWKKKQKLNCLYLLLKY